MQLNENTEIAHPDEENPFAVETAIKAETSTVVETDADETNDETDDMTSESKKKGKKEKNPEWLLRKNVFYEWLRHHNFSAEKTLFGDIDAYLRSLDWAILLSTAGNLSMASLDLYKHVCVFVTNRLVATATSEAFGIIGTNPVIDQLRLVLSFIVYKSVTTLGDQMKALNGVHSSRLTFDLLEPIMKALVEALLGGASPSFGQASIAQTSATIGQTSATVGKTVAKKKKVKKRTVSETEPVVTIADNVDPPAPAASEVEPPKKKVKLNEAVHEEAVEPVNPYVQALKRQ